MSLYESSTGEEKRGYALVGEEVIIIPKHLKSYIDYGTISRNHAMNTSENW